MVVAAAMRKGTEALAWQGIPFVCDLASLRALQDKGGHTSVCVLYTDHGRSEGMANMSKGAFLVTDTACHVAMIVCELHLLVEAQ